jgi:hypothetical protein
MDDAASNEIRERQRINSHLDYFWSLPTWTPAMGALLVSGVSPLPDCSVIPKAGSDLSSPGTAARQSALLEAQGTMELWREYWEIETKNRPSVEAPIKLEPLNFLNWCIDEFEHSADWLKPSWLRYWLAFTQIEIDDRAPLPAPARLVTRAAELEAFATIIHSKATVAEPSPTTAKAQPTSELTNLVIESIKSRGRSTIKAEIITALAFVNDPRNASAVWVYLCEMARNGRHLTLQYVDDVTLKIPEGKRGWNDYTRDALTQYLGRHTKIAEDQLRQRN